MLWNRRGRITWNGDSTYLCEISSNGKRADQVGAKGVSINSGALVSFTSIGNRTLPSGATFTILDNRSPQPIAGTFSNLPDGSTFVVGRNTFLASYEGGDGNDLTLTVQ